MPTDALGVPVTFTLDVEDHRPDRMAEVRFDHMTREVLSFCAARGIRGTAFVVGEVAEQYPDLVREIVAGGHEIGLHGWQHIPLDTLTPEGLRADAQRGKAVLEDLSGTEVVGFRAPTFSLTPGCAWAPEVLREVGFGYSASVLPGRNPLYSWPGIPNAPFVWPSGLLEIPGFVLGRAPLQIPTFGGVYARVLPWPIVKRGFQAMAKLGPCHLYCHPYDFDPGERFYVLDELGPMLSPIAWVGRRRMYDRVARICADPAPPFVERLADIRSQATAASSEEP